MRLSLYYGLPFLRRDFCLRRILAVRIWRNLLFLIGCVIGSREEHLCLVHVCFGFQMCVRCCQPFVAELASGISDVDPNGHVVRLSFVGCCHPFVAEAASFVWFGFFSQFCGIWDWPLFVGWDPSDFWFLKWIPCSLLTLFWIHQTFCFWNGAWKRCRRQNLLLLIRFQHEGVCEAWTPGSWLPWWTI